MQLQIRLDGEIAVAELDSHRAPRSCAALAGLLPYSGVAHYAKIAGQEFMVHLPLILDIEGRSAVNDLPSGSVVFWPERQLLCVYYGQIQDEDAEVTVLGRVAENLERLIAAGEAVRVGQGRRNAMAEFRLLGHADVSGVDAGSHRLAGGTRLDAQIMAAYMAAAHSMPTEVERLLQRRGVMRPGGPLLYAEGETRTLHGLLWVLRLGLRRGEAATSLVRDALRYFARRLGGWYGLKEAGELVSAVAMTLPSLPPDEALPAVEALALYVGQLNMWLDGQVPWDAFNLLLQPLEVAQP